MSRVTTLVFSIIGLVLLSAGIGWYHPNAFREVSNETITNSSVRIGGPFLLTDQNGNLRSDKDFRGKFMLVFFGYTYCPDVCPTTLALMKTALNGLGVEEKEIAPIFISVDPKRDTPEKLKSYLSSFGPEFIGLTGSDEEVANAAKAYHTYYHANPTADENYTVDHSGLIYLMGPDGLFVSYYPPETSDNVLANDLKERIRLAKPTG